MRLRHSINNDAVVRVRLCGAGSMKRYGVRPSVRLSVPSSDRCVRDGAAGLLLSAVLTADIDRRRRRRQPVAHQQRRRSTALSSKLRSAAANASSVTFTADVGI